MCFFTIGLTTQAMEGSRLGKGTGGFCGSRGSSLGVLLPRTGWLTGQVSQDTTGPVSAEDTAFKVRREAERERKPSAVPSPVQPPCSGVPPSLLPPAAAVPPLTSTGEPKTAQEAGQCSTSRMPCAFLVNPAVCAQFHREGGHATPFHSGP